MLSQSQFLPHRPHPRRDHGVELQGQLPKGSHRRGWCDVPNFRSILRDFAQFTPYQVRARTGQRSQGIFSAMISTRPPAGRSSTIAAVLRIAM